MNEKVCMFNKACTAKTNKLVNFFYTGVKWNVWMYNKGKMSEIKCSPTFMFCLGCCVNTSDLEVF